MRRTILFAGVLSLALMLAACDGEGTPEPGVETPGAETPEAGTPDISPGTATPGTPMPGTPMPGTPTPGTPTPGGTPAGGGNVAQGEAIFTGAAGVVQPACTSCHTVGGGSLVGPDLQGLATRAGQTVAGVSAEEYIRQSILEPNAHVAEGFSQGIMPQNFGDQLSEEQLDALVAYLMTLE